MGESSRVSLSRSGYDGRILLMCEHRCALKVFCFACAIRLKITVGPEILEAPIRLCRRA
jgi:hypothetical protein